MMSHSNAFQRQFQKGQDTVHIRCAVNADLSPQLFTPSTSCNNQGVDRNQNKPPFGHVQPNYAYL